MNGCQIELIEIQTFTAPWRLDLHPTRRKPSMGATLPGIPVGFHHLVYRIKMMASQVENSNSQHESTPKGPFRWSACVLGLIFPGLGHFFIGERGRAYRIAGGFLVLFLGGLLIGGPGSVRMSNPSYSTGGAGKSRNLWFYAQLGAGPIALVFSQIDESILKNAPEESMIPMSTPKGGITTVHENTPIGHAAEFGTLYCALAGLMNVAIALDAGNRSSGDRRSQRRSGGEIRIRRSQSTPSGEST